MIGTASDAIGSWLQDTLGLTHWTLIAGIIVLVFLKFGFDKNQISIKVFISKNRLLLIVCALAVAGIIWDAFMAGNRSEPVENPASTASLTLRPTPTFAPSPAAALVSVGDTVRFGSYEWRVLDVDERNNKALLITKDIIEMRPYNVEWESITWETCTLRQYLNGEFYNSFRDNEKAMIAETRNVNTDNPGYGTEGGNDTIDRVFLLSINEANGYFKNDHDRAASYGGSPDWWWLRSPGRDGDDAAFVFSYGGVNDDGNLAYDGAVGVRPALWVNLSS